MKKVNKKRMIRERDFGNINKIKVIRMIKMILMWMRKNLINTKKNMEQITVIIDFYIIL
jgi:hypothetical protein